MISFFLQGGVGRHNLYINGFDEELNAWTILIAISVKCHRIDDYAIHHPSIH